jgi:hypothetical protein
MSEPVAAARTTLPVLAVVTLLACAVVASTWHVFGHTWDEPEHIAAGMSLVDRGHYDYDIQHPPIARAVLAVGPYLAGARSQGSPPPDGRPEGLAILYDIGHYDLYLTLARAGALPFLALMIFVTYAWARRVLPPAGALIASGFVATTPPVLGHAGLATLDVPAAATCLLALFAVQRWLESGSWRSGVGVGLAAALAIGTKLSAIPYLGLGALVLMGLSVWRRRATPTTPGRARAIPWVRQALAATLCMAAVLTLAYGGRFIYLTDDTHRYNQALGYLFGYAGPVHDAAYTVFAHVKVPEAFPLIVGGIEALSVHNQNGHLSYLLGEVRTSGWWYFYLVALAVKTPLPLLGLGVFGLGLLAREGWRGRDGWSLAPAMLAVVLLSFASAVSHINIGVRHVLVLYPLLAIGAAFALDRAWHALDRRRGRARIAGVTVLAGLVAWQLAGVVRTWPDYLAYFNELVREPERVLVDSDLDWGQDLKRLARRLAELGVPNVSLAYLGTAALGRESLPPFVRLEPDQHAVGWVAVSALARIHAPQRFAWLDAFTPRERVGRSIDLYYIPGNAAAVPGPPTP